MKRYFEFIDDKSCKFWEIDVVDASVNVRFGKIGTAGSSSPKAFLSHPEALAAAAKLITEKTHKGYVERDQPSDSADAKSKMPTAVNADQRPYRFITYEEFSEKYEDIMDFDEYLASDYDYFMLYEGDLKIDGNMLLDKKLPDVNYPKGAKPNSGIIFITGNLEVTGTVANYEEYGPHLVVGGNVSARDLLSGNGSIYVCGNVNLRGVLCGFYNDGYLVINGDVTAQLYFIPNII